MKTTAKRSANATKKAPRPESHRRQLARLLKKAIAGEITFADTDSVGHPPRPSYRRIIE